VRLGNIAANGDVVGLLLISADSMFKNKTTRFLSNMPPIPNDAILGVVAHIRNHAPTVPDHTANDLLSWATANGPLVERYLS
jgi:hypothetical protein